MSEQNNDMMAVLQRMQQQLTYLEKKLDTLIAQSKPSQARPYRPFKRPDSASSGYGHSRGPTGHGSHGSSSHGYKRPYFGRPKDR